MFPGRPAPIGSYAPGGRYANGASIERSPSRSLLARLARLHEAIRLMRSGTSAAHLSAYLLVIRDTRNRSWHSSATRCASCGGGVTVSTRHGRKTTAQAVGAGPSETRGIQ
jgi:hypothetical protein